MSLAYKDFSNQSGMPMQAVAWVRDQNMRVLGTAGESSGGGGAVPARETPQATSS